MVTRPATLALRMVARGVWTLKKCDVGSASPLLLVGHGIKSSELPIQSPLISAYYHVLSLIFTSERCAPSTQATKLLKESITGSNGKKCGPKKRAVRIGPRQPAFARISYGATCGERCSALRYPVRARRFPPLRCGGGKRTGFGFGGKRGEALGRNYFYDRIATRHYHRTIRSLSFASARLVVRAARWDIDPYLDKGVRRSAETPLRQPFFQLRQERHVYSNGPILRSKAPEERHIMRQEFCYLANIQQLTFRPPTELGQP